MNDLHEYVRPRSPEEAVAVKRQYGPRSVYLAGGSDLLVHRPRAVEVAIDTRHAGIEYVRDEADAIVIGGAARLRDIERHAGHVAGGMFGLAVQETAPWLIRNAATLAGNIANASPAADGVLALLVLDARLLLLGEQQELCPMTDVFERAHQTNLGDRLIQEIRIPREATARAAAFIKLARTKSDIAQVNVAVGLTCDGDLVQTVRIALGAVAPVPLRARGAEALLEGNRLTQDLVHQVGEAVKSEVRPISDWRASADYRRAMSGVLVRRALLAAWNSSRNGGRA